MKVLVPLLLGCLAIVIGAWISLSIESGKEHGKEHEIEIPAVVQPPATSLQLPIAESGWASHHIVDQVNGSKSVALNSQEDSPTFENEVVSEILDQSAVASLRDSMENGDSRAPSLTPTVERILPSDAELEDYDLYQSYEQNQTKKLYQAYVVASREKLNLLTELIDEARANGMTEEELAVGIEKRRRIEEMMNSLNNELAR